LELPRALARGLMNTQKNSFSHINYGKWS